MIDPADPDCREQLADLRRAVQRLALMSHAPIQGYNFAPSDVGRGERWRLRDARPPIAHLGQHSPKGGDTQIPRGNIDQHGDFQLGYRQKSHVYFERKLGRLLRDPKATKDDLLALALEAEQALATALATCEGRGVSAFVSHPVSHFDLARSVSPLRVVKKEERRMSEKDEPLTPDELTAWMFEHGILERTALVGGVPHFALSQFGHELTHVLAEIHSRLGCSPVLPVKGHG